MTTNVHAPERVQHRRSKVKGTVLEAELRSPATGWRYIDDDEGEWCLVLFDDGILCWCPRDALLSDLQS